MSDMSASVYNMATAAYSRKGHVSIKSQETVGQRVRKARELRGWRQDELAGRITGASQGVVSKWETGRREPGLENVVALARALGVSTEWLITGEPPMERQEGDVHAHAEAFGQIAAIVMRVVGYVEGEETTVRLDQSERVEEGEGATLSDG